jgi:predicted permease
VAFARLRLFWTRIFLLLIIGAIIGFMRRPSYRSALPTIVVIASSLLASRNIAVALVVMVPALAARYRWPRIDRRRSPHSDFRAIPVAPRGRCLLIGAATAASRDTTSACTRRRG